jgi:hypothetical protein
MKLRLSFCLALCISGVSASKSAGIQRLLGCRRLRNHRRLGMGRISTQHAHRVQIYDTSTSTVVATLQANLYRSDLEHAGLGIWIGCRHSQKPAVQACTIETHETVLGCGLEVGCKGIVRNLG